MRRGHVPLSMASHKIHGRFLSLKSAASYAPPISPTMDNRFHSHVVSPLLLVASQTTRLCNTHSYSFTKATALVAQIPHGGMPQPCRRLHGAAQRVADARARQELHIQAVRL